MDHIDVKYKEYHDIEEVVEAANEIYQSIKGSDPKELANAYEFITQSNQFINNRFPIVLRTMIMEKDYNEKAFRKYIKWMHSRKFEFPTKEDKAESYTKYLVLLFKEIHTHYDMKKVQFMERDLKAAFLKEFESVSNAKDKLPEMKKRSDQQLLEYKKQQLYDLIMKKKRGELE
jgi:hypothetical protein